MDLIRARLTLANPRRPDLSGLEVEALADTGALHLCLPRHVALQLALDELEKREVTLASGTKEVVSYMGPVVVRFQNRACYAGALVLGDEVLLGAVPMEDMDVILSPARRAVIVNPDSPNIATSTVK